MREINARDLQCENCRKFSHCNNNELVCISKFKQLKVENEELRARNSRDTLAFLEEDFKKEQKIKKYKQCLDEIEEIARTLGNQNDVKHRLDDSGVQDLFKIDDDLLSSEEIMRKRILQLIKQVNEGGNNEKHR